MNEITSSIGYPSKEEVLGAVDSLLDQAESAKYLLLRHDNLYAEPLDELPSYEERKEIIGGPLGTANIGGIPCIVDDTILIRPGEPKINWVATAMRGAPPPVCGNIIFICREDS